MFSSSLILVVSLMLLLRRREDFKSEYGVQDDESMYSPCLDNVSVGRLDASLRNFDLSELILFISNTISTCLIHMWMFELKGGIA